MTKQFHFPNLSKILPLTRGIKLLLSYQRQWLGGDVLAGITVAAYAIPQCMAYGELAGVEPVVGLWSLIPAALLYALLGSSPQLSIGPESTTAVMTAAAIAPLLTQDQEDYNTMAALLAVLVGLVCVVGYLGRLGFLANLLSKPILIGYMAGVAIIMIAGQLGKITRVNLEAKTVFGVIKEFFGQRYSWHWPTLILSLVLLVFLFTIQHFFPKAPGPLLAVLLGTMAVSLLKLEERGVILIGTLPDSFPRLGLPSLELSDILSLLATAIGIAIVGYSDNVLTARAFAVKDRYEIDANQEFLALGIANIGVGCFQGFPISSSASRAAIANSLGSKSQVFSLVAVGVVFGVLLFLRPLLALFPKAALGAIVIFAACHLIDIPEFLKLKRFRNSELLLALMTVLGVVATDILTGVAIAIGVSVIDLFARITRPHDAVLGMVPAIPGLHDIEDWQGATTLPGLVIYRYDAPLFFANAEDFKRRALQAIASEKDPVQWFILNTEAIVELDTTALAILEELYHELHNRNITFGLARVKHDLYLQLRRGRLLDKIGEEHIYFTLPTAMEAFRQRLRQNHNNI